MGWNPIKAFGKAVKSVTSFVGTAVGSVVGTVGGAVGGAIGSAIPWVGTAIGASIGQSIGNAFTPGSKKGKKNQPNSFAEGLAQSYSAKSSEGYQVLYISKTKWFQRLRRLVSRLWVYITQHQKMLRLFAFALILMHFLFDFALLYWLVRNCFTWRWSNHQPKKNYQKMGKINIFTLGIIGIGLFMVRRMEIRKILDLYSNGEYLNKVYNDVYTEHKNFDVRLTLL